MPCQLLPPPPAPVHLAVIRERVERGGLARFIPAACGEVWTFLRTPGMPRGGRHVAVYLDEDGLVEVGAEVTAPFTGNERVRCSSLPSGASVTAVHLGPYARLGEVHGEIRRWCSERGHRLAGVSWEIYGHWEESWNRDPAKIRTDVFHLLAEPAVNGAR